MKNKFNKIIELFKYNYEIIISILYFLILEILYYFLEFKVMTYIGYFFKFNFGKFIIGWLLYILTTLKLAKEKNENISTLFFTIFFNVSIAPFLIIYQFGKANLFMALIQIIALFIMLYVYKTIKYNFDKILNKKKLPILFTKFCNIKLSTKIYIIYGIIIIIVGYFFIKNGLPNFKLINFDDISLVRKNAKFSTFEIIIQTLSCKITIPLLITYFLKNKKILNVILLSIFQLYIFSITGFKTYLLILALIYVITFLERLNQKKMIICGLFIMVLLTGILCFFTRDYRIPSITVNRFLFFPAQIKWAYLDFFSNNPFLFFSQTTIGHLFSLQSPYNKNIVFLIGEIYFHAPEMWANTGFIIDGYANMGVIGIIIVSICFAFILYFIELTLKNNKRNIGYIVYLIYFLSLNDGSLIYTMFSGGLLIAIIFIGLINLGTSDEKI